jgi:hypothetical protein
MTGTDERLGTADRTVGTATTDEDHLADELARLVAVADPVPAAWAVDARATFAWRAISGAEARLDYDAEVVGRHAADNGAGQGGGARRQVRYACGPQAVELDVDTADEAVRLVGRVAPSASVPVVVHWPGGQRSTTSDEDGVFRLDDLPREPLCVQVLAEQPLKTGWLVP